MKKSIGYIFLSLLVLSCLEQPNCIHTNNNTVGIYFKTMFDGKSDTVKIVGITASGTDSVFYPLKQTTFVSLPLNYLTNTSRFNIQALNRSYVLDLGFKVLVQFVTKDCPERYVLSDLAIREHLGVDSIKLISSALSNPPANNITIYRCPDNRLMKVSFRQWYMDTLSRGKLDTRAVTSITADYLGTVSGQASLNTMLLPLNTASDKTLFTFTFADGSANTLNVKYTVASQTLFSICGVQKIPHKLSPLSTNFEILHLRRDSIYDLPKTNIELFRCPVTHQLTAVFKDTSGQTVTDTLKSITADFMGTDTLYRNVIRSSVVLPLNPAADNTTYRFQFKTKTNVLTLGYTRTDQVYHSECGTQKQFTLLQVAQSSGFSSAPKVTEPTIKFPTVNNLEIIQ